MKSHQTYRLLSAIAVVGCWGADRADAGEAVWDGGGADDNWYTASNWVNDTLPVADDYARLNGTVVYSSGSSPNLQAIRVGNGAAGSMEINGGTLTATINSSWDSYVGSAASGNGTVTQNAGDVVLNQLQIGRDTATGSYTLNGGSLVVARARSDYSLYLGTADSKTSTGYGSLTVNGGSLTTRMGVYLGSAGGGTGSFTVNGSDATIGIGSYIALDGAWFQNAGSTLSVRIDTTPTGVSRIFIDEVGDDGGGDVTFESGALLDVGFTGAFVNGGTFTVMEWEGTLTNHGLQFAPGVDTSIWSYTLDAANKKLTVTAQGEPYTEPPFTFVHPGIWHKRSDLDRMKYMVAAGIDPWFTSFSTLASKNSASYTYTVRKDPLDNTLSRENPAHQRNQYEDDAIAAYHNSLMWYITGDSRHAQKSVEILNAWSSLTNFYGGGTEPLCAGLYGSPLVNAAEIIKSTYSGWAAPDIQKFKDMLVYPGYSNTTVPTSDIANDRVTFYWRTYMGDPGRHGNQGLLAWRTVMAIGIFLDNEIIYDRALRNIQGLPHRSDDIPYPTGPPITNPTPTGNSCEYFHDYSLLGRATTIPDYGYDDSIEYYVYDNGQCQKSSRDQVHSSLGIGAITEMMEVAWNQGTDIYQFLEYRVLKGLEFTLKYNLSAAQSYPDQATPWEPDPFYQYTTRTGRWKSLKINPWVACDTNRNSRGAQVVLRPVLELPAAHFSVREDMANEATWLLRSRDYAIATAGYEQGDGTDYAGWGGLTYRRPDFCAGDPVKSFRLGKPVYAMHVLPGTVEAEHFDFFSGDAEGRVYHDLTSTNSGGQYRLTEGVDIATCSEGGYALTDLEAEEWVTYTVSVPSTATYDISIRYAASATGGKMRFRFGGADKTGDVTVPFGSPHSTGVTDWRDHTMATGVLLPKGVQSMKISISGASAAFDLNAVTIVRDTNVLVGHWTFDGGSRSVAVDSSGFGNDGAVVNAPQVPGTDGDALAFNGSSSQVVIPAAAFSPISSEITIAMWVYGDPLQPLPDSLFYAVSGNNRVLNIHLPWDNSTVYWDAGNSSGYDRISKVATDAEFKGSWSHWAFSKNASSGTMKIHRNGVLWHSNTGQTKPITGITAATIGSQISGAYYTGTMDDVRLYNIALSDQEIESLYYQYAVHNVSGLAAESIDASRIALRWGAASGASSYNLKRSTTSGGPYALLAGGLSSTNHSDTGLSAGTRYYYVVSAVYDGTESGNCDEVVAVPSALIDPDDVVLETVMIDPGGGGGQNLSMSVATSGLGHAYQVMTTESLMIPVWVDAMDVLPGNGEELQIAIPIQSEETNRFYRLKAWRQ